jgi:hypothetical protein
VGLRNAVLALAFLVPASAHAQTEWQIRPFAGFTFGGGTTLLDLDDATGGFNTVFGAGVALLGDVAGVEADIGYAPGFFEGGDARLVSSGSVTTITGNVILGPPRRVTEYTLRPYFVGGFGLVHVRTFDSLSVFSLSLTRPALDLGGGVTGALSDRTALSWELRYFRSVGGDLRGQSFGPEELSFWRANMAVVFRY